MESIKHLIIISTNILVVAVLVLLSTAIFFGVLKVLMNKAFKNNENQLVFGIILISIVIAFAIIAGVAILPQY